VCLDLIQEELIKKVSRVRQYIVECWDAKKEHDESREDSFELSADLTFSAPNSEYTV
jgi:hypothetical protein